MPAPNYQTTRNLIPENYNLKIQSCEELKSHTLYGCIRIY